jgi:hypothetical protein
MASALGLGILPSGLKHVDSLPNPDPSDIDAPDENAPKVASIKIDENAEAERPENKRKAQEWAGIKQDPPSCLWACASLVWVMSSTCDLSTCRRDDRSCLKVGICTDQAREYKRVLHEPQNAALWWRDVLSSPR